MKKILITTILLALLSLSLCLYGCGGKSNQAEDSEATSILRDIGQAMSGVSSYRVSGNTTIRRSGIEATGDTQGEVQIVNGEIHSHFQSTMQSPLGPMPGTETYYSIGRQQYISLANGAWLHGNINLLAFRSMMMLQTSAFSPPVGLGQLAVIIKTAPDLQVSDADSERSISFHLGEDYVNNFSASLKSELLKSGQWTSDDQQQLDAYDASLWQADVTIVVSKENNLIDRIETDSTKYGADNSPQETIKIVWNLSDYNQDIRVELPQEAKNSPGSPMIPPVNALPS